MRKATKIAAAAMAALIAGTALTASMASAQSQSAPPAPAATQADSHDAGKPMRMSHRGEGKRWGGRGEQRMERLFERFDLNGDGSFTQEDVDTVNAEAFAKADTTGSGSLTLDEFKAHFMDRSADRQVRGFQRLDRNGDGVVTQEDFIEITDRMFNRFDRNGDGELTRVDRHGQKAGENGKGGGRDAARGKGRHHHAHGPRGQMRAVFNYMDADGNGTVTRAEFEQARDALYALADPDGAGSFQLDGFRNIFAEVSNDRVVRMFQRLDKDGSLEITQEEFAAPTSNLVERLDRNQDGVVTKADMQRGKHGKKHRHGEHQRGDAHHKKHGQTGRG
ncbi:Ca2+-binding EF-hand superfamily protein [Roseibium hamelinense]|uniref:Ca2+-binding EF-hand superfamily protein n=1 Tax=Roseibium hamelinense TaxID=150831 RepID=A0A562TIA2_9HYPH|nr:EF-hand domain-containing protein [Roseibium hamelinense]MTI42751.1 EF-hand domain-containing protein [Roseibium hamelinense]TWI93397.1 Ca2+-binding EF-hand superfamily protein [Roseibium hamelinense]